MGSIVQPTRGLVVGVGDDEGLELVEGVGLSELTEGVGDGEKLGLELGMGVGVTVGVGDDEGLGIGIFSIAYLAADIISPFVLSIIVFTILPSSATPS